MNFIFSHTVTITDLTFFRVKLNSEESNKNSIEVSYLERDGREQIKYIEVKRTYKLSPPPLPKNGNYS